MSTTHKRAQQGCSPSACRSQCLRDYVVHIKLTIAESGFDLRRSHGRVTWHHYIWSLKKVFSLVVSRHILVLLWKRVNCCCLLTLFLPCHIPLAVPFSQTLLLGLPRFRHGQVLFLVCSTNISLTHADINFFSCHFTDQYRICALHCMLLSFCYSLNHHHIWCILRLWWHFFINSKLHDLTVHPLCGKQGNMWREYSFHLQDWLFDFKPIS